MNIHWNTEIIIFHWICCTSTKGLVYPKCNLSMTVNESKWEYKLYTMGINALTDLWCVLLLKSCGHVHVYFPWVRPETIFLLRLDNKVILFYSMHHHQKISASILVPWEIMKCNFITHTEFAKWNKKKNTRVQSARYFQNMAVLWGTSISF